VLRILVCVLLLVLAGPAVGSDARAPTAGAAGQAVYRLPRYTDPDHLALAADGSSWLVDQFGGPVRLQPDGRTQTFPPSDDEDGAEDVAAASDGSVWVAADGEVMRIAAGSGSEWSIGGEIRAVTAVGDAAWVTVEEDENHAFIQRVTAAGPGRRFVIRSPHELMFGGIAAAADGTLWFTEGNYRRTWIGRMTADGRYAYWRVPGYIFQPPRIAAGSDGAMWFTEPHAIGRITADGQITRFPLAGAAVPHDIVAGGDGNLWLTSDICLERITAAGQMTTWPVPGALKLTGLARAADGSVWLADKVANAVRHFDPSTVAPAPCGAPTLVRSRHATSVTVSFERDGRYRGVDEMFGLRIHISRHGQELFHEAVPPQASNAATVESRSVFVRDLDGDGEPEVMLLLYGNCAGGCPWSRIYRYDRARNTYVVLRHAWGDGGATPRVRDLDGDGRPEFISQDDRFGAYILRGGPIQIWFYRRGVLRDVTRRYPGPIRRDAAKLWRWYRAHGRRSGRYVLPLWTADEYLLGRQAAADRVLEQIAAKGGLKRHYGDYGPRSPWAFILQLKALLRRIGYSRSG
jgi:virginiamycin B lyase